MQEFSLWLIETLIVGGVLAAMVCCVGRCLPSRPNLIHALWLVVVVKMVTPSLALFDWLPVSIQPSTSDLPRSFSAPASGAPGGPQTAATDKLSADTFDATFLMQETLATALGWVVMLTAATLLAARSIGMLRLRSWAMNGRAPTPQTEQAVAIIANRLGIKTPRILIDSGFPICVAALPRAYLLLPENTSGEPGLRAALVHELSHLKRRDHWTAMFLQVAGCLWWWNPIFRWAQRELRDRADHACDSRALQMMPQARIAFAERLVTAAEQGLRPACAHLGGARTKLTRRLSFVLHGEVKPERPITCILAVLLLFTPNLVEVGVDAGLDQKLAMAGQVLPLDGANRIHIEILAGDIHIRQGSDHEGIRVEILDPDPEAIANHVSVTRDRDAIRVRVLDGSRVRILVSINRARHIEARTRKGDVTVQGSALASVDLNSGEGHIRIAIDQAAGSIIAHARFGEVSADWETVASATLSAGVGNINLSARAASRGNYSVNLAHGNLLSGRDLGFDSSFQNSSRRASRPGNPIELRVEHGNVMVR